jgi:hypothetical protein
MGFRNSPLLLLRVVAFQWEPEKIRPIVGNDRPLLISPRGILVEALGVWGRGFNERLGNRCGLGMRQLHSMRDVLANMQCRISTQTAVALF